MNSMAIVKEAKVSDAEQLAFIIRAANKPVVQAFGINQGNDQKHPSFYKTDWVKADFERGERYFILQNSNAEAIAWFHRRRNQAF